VGIQTVRYYERRGLIARPARRPSGQRWCEPGTVDVLQTVKRAQRVGFSLEEIDELLRLSGSPVRRGDLPREPLRPKIAEIDARIGDLRQMRAALQAALHAGVTPWPAARTRVAPSGRGRRRAERDPVRH
jgi:DNA-binding transcriptional MerR regulator